jgi:hypothetical protein
VTSLAEIAVFTDDVAAAVRVVGSADLRDPNGRLVDLAQA